MRVAVTGSVANDYLMSFQGRFAEQIVPEQLHRLSVSFLVEDLQVRRGGNGANIAYGIAQLGVRPYLAAAVGPDFDEYRAWLERHGVDTSAVHVSDVHYTARFHCTTDLEQNQIASFYAGAMADAVNIELAPLSRRIGGLDLVVVSPNAPGAMLRHTGEAKETGIPFMADPSQQLASLDGDAIAELVTGARFLVTNDYEWALIQSKTGWSHDELVSRAEISITTHGADGCVVEARGEEPVKVKAAPVREIVEPTGVGDAFRSGFIVGQSWGLDLEQSAQVGCTLASVVLEQDGPQEYEIEPAVFAQRVGDAYGTDITSSLSGPAR